MTKRRINVFEHSAYILEKLGNGGILLNSRSGDKTNTMTIGWGMIGIEWNRPIFSVLVREGRYTRQLLDDTRAFGISVPYGDFDNKILGFCGSRSGRDTDKTARLSLVKGEKIDVPAIKELPLTIECKIIYRQLQDKNEVLPEIREKSYPEDVPGDSPLSNRDYHVLYMGEIVDAYIIE